MCKNTATGKISLFQYFSLNFPQVPFPFKSKTGLRSAFRSRTGHGPRAQPVSQRPGFWALTSPAHTCQPLCACFHVRTREVTAAAPAWGCHELRYYEGKQDVADHGKPPPLIPLCNVRVLGARGTGPHTRVRSRWLTRICWPHVTSHLTLLFLFLIHKNADADTNFPTFT